MQPMSKDLGPRLDEQDVEASLKVDRGLASEVVFIDLHSPNCDMYAVAPTFEELIVKLRPFGH